MVDIARITDGSHYFVKSMESLEKSFLKELHLASSVAARNIRIRVEHPGFRRARIVGDVFSERVSTSEETIASIGARETRSIIFELIEPISSGDATTSCHISYDDSDGMSHSMILVAHKPENAKEERVVAVEYLKKQAVEDSHRAMLSKDAGNNEEAQQILTQSSQV
jgi:hypothetical protein